MATSRRQPRRITRKREKNSGATAPTKASKARRRAKDRASGAPRRPGGYRPAWAGASAGGGHADAGAGGRLDELPRDLLLRAAREKLPWVQRFVRERCPRGKLTEYATLYAKANGIAESAIPPYSTLNTWAHRLAAGGLAALVDAPSRQAGQSRAVTGEVAKHFETGVLLGKGAMGILHYLSQVLPPGTRLPKYPSVYRALKAYEQREPLLVALARMGPTWFRDHCEEALSHGIFPGGLRLTIDSTVADVWVKVWLNGEFRAYRPVLTVVEDVGSRALVTFNLSLYAIDSGICLGVLGRALNEDRNYPGLPSVGVPHEITMDKGAEHQGAFREALTLLGIDVVPRKDNDPRGGAHVESLIGTITEEVFKNVPNAYSACERPFNAYARSDRDVKRNLASLKYDAYKREVPIEALPTLQDVEAAIWGWATLYNERPHVSLPVDSPEVQEGLRRVQRIVARQHPFTPDVETDASDAERVA